MKQFIWMLCGIFLSGLLLGTLSACGADQFGVSVITTSRTPASPAPADIPEDMDGGAETAPDAAPETTAAPGGDAARNLAYANVLEDALFNGCLPDGTRLDWTSAEEAAKNQFAVCDVDGDGEEELLLRWTNAGGAGMMDVVFRYDGQGVSQELREYAGVEFYGSGAAKAGWSHNQGWAGRFWPFNLYRYDDSSGAYQEAGAVDAWDRSLFEDDETLSAAFPADADLDGDGLVYYILPSGYYQNDRVPADGRLDGRLWGMDPVDGPDMENWLNVYVDGTELIQLPLRELTAENISDLGYWSIPGPSQEPAD